MNLQNRIIIVVFAVMALSFGSFVWMVNTLPGSVRRNIDEELAATVRQMISESETRSGIELEEIDWPNSISPMDASTLFYSVLSPEEVVVNQSENLPIERQIFDVTSTSEVAFGDVTFGGQALRVLNYPIIAEFDDEPELLGHLQVAQPINDFAYLERLTSVLVMVGGASLSLATFSLAIMVPVALRRLTGVVEAVDQINSAEDLTMRIEVSESAGNVEQLGIAINRLLERMSDLFKTQQRLLADVSHELRTPLTAIRGNVDLIRRVGADPESLDAIETEAERMTRLVTDLLTLARAEGGGLPIREEVVDLDILFLETYEQISMISSPVRVILQDIDVARVLGDPDRLKQLILNLITNARKYTNDGGTVTVGLTTAAENAYVRVADTGVGIPESDLPHIFDRFYRVSKARARTQQRGGAGLGLAIAKSIALAHGGDISVTSEVAVGSVFTVRVPLLQG